MANQDLTGIGTASQALESATREARELIYEFLSPVAKESGRYIADKIRVVRIANITKMLNKAKKKLDAQSVPISPIALKIFVPILEGCSLEEEDGMIEKWANLLSAAASSARVLPSYIRILADLTPQEARILDKTFDQSSMEPMKVGDLHTVDSLTDEQFLNAILNLQRLELLAMKFKETTFLAGGVPVATKDTDLIGLTLFGRRFAQVVCRPPASNLEVKERG
jgi:vacuolar-type H+-ATPase subunit H